MQAGGGTQSNLSCRCFLESDTYGFWCGCSWSIRLPLTMVFSLVYTLSNRDLFRAIASNFTHSPFPPPPPLHTHVCIQHIFQQVAPHQCLAYTRNPKKSHAPTVHAAIEHFNRVSLVVIATILGGGASSSMGRAQVVTQWIDIAQQCRMVKNFSSLKAIVSGMQSSAIFRLSRSWEEVPV